MARIVVIEKALHSRVELEIAQTRQTYSAYYKINPSGRVPYLILDDDSRMEGSAVICAYLDQIDGNPTLVIPEADNAWEAQGLLASAYSTLEGLAVWARELRRPIEEQSPTIIAHEEARAARMLNVWERHTAHPLLTGPLNMLQIVLACSLGLEALTLGAEWHASHPKLSRWYASIAQRPSFIATQPPSPQ
jgi:glutathione S-transferase